LFISAKPTSATGANRCLRLAKATSQIGAIFLTLDIDKPSTRDAGETHKVSSRFGTLTQTIYMLPNIYFRHEHHLCQKFNILPFRSISFFVFKFIYISFCLSFTGYCANT
jgi:hypothetical protein